MVIYLKKMGFLVCLLACVTQPVWSQQAPLVGDSMETLKLSEPLHAYGRLGGMCTDKLGFLYVANFRDAVWRVSTDGEVKLLTDALYGSSGNVVNAEGDLLQANFYGHTISKITRTGEVTTFLSKELNGPVGLAFDGENNLYVCNCNDNRILKVTPQKEVSTFASGKGFQCPNSIALGSKGNLFVANFNNDKILQITPAGEVSTFATVPGGGGNAHLAYSNNNFYLTKIKTNTLYRINEGGEYALIAGTGKTGVVDGPALQAQLSAPNGITVGSDGSIYTNELDGTWSTAGWLQEAEPMVIRRLKRATLDRIFRTTYAAQGLDSAQAAYWRYIKDPMNRFENVSTLVSSLGWQFMIERKVKEAITVFNLQTATYPDNWLGSYNLAEVYKIIGQKDQAKSYYQKALALDPDNATVKAKLEAFE